MQPPVKLRYYKLEVNTDLTTLVITVITSNRTMSVNLNPREFRGTAVLCSTPRMRRRFSSGDSGAHRARARALSATGRA